MQEKVKSSQNIASGINSILERVSNFFHIFDFPFFVSGFVVLGAVFFFNVGNINEASPFLSTWLGIISIFISSYVLGLISFTFGRILNKYFRTKVLENNLEDAIYKHHLNENESISRYQSYSKNNDWHLYARLWQNLIRHRSDSLAINHLSRYWALAALYDSLSFSFLVWSAAFFIAGNSGIFSTGFNDTMELILGVVSLIFVVGTLYQGCRYYKYQIVDLIASTAAEKSKIA